MTIKSRESLAEAVLAFQLDFDFDLIKVTPASSYAVRDWGVTDRWAGSTEGTRETLRHPVRESTDWAALERLEVGSGALGEHLACLRQILELPRGGAPVVATVFSPLAQARKLAGEETFTSHLTTEPAAVLAGLERITDTSVSFVETLHALGVDGVFYAVQHAGEAHFDRAGYERFGLPFDRRILDAAQGMWLNILHLHGRDVFFDLSRELPITVVNWHDQETWPDLGEGRRRSGRAVCGGIAREASLVLGDPGRVRSEAQRAWQATARGSGLILGTGCVTPIHAPRANLRAVRSAVDEMAEPQAGSGHRGG